MIRGLESVPPKPHMALWTFHTFLFKMLAKKDKQPSFFNSNTNQLRVLTVALNFLNSMTLKLPALHFRNIFLVIKLENMCFVSTFLSFFHFKI